VGASITVVTGAVGNALYTNAGAGPGRFGISSANVNVNIGTLGFFFNRITATVGGDRVHLNFQDTIPRFALMADTNTSMWWRYKDGSQTLTAAANTIHYLECAWDNTGNRQSYRLNNGSWVEQTGLTGSPPVTGGDLKFGPSGGESSDMWFDQIMISDIYQKDLYAVRNSTNP
jgi:hypothetical protein